MTHTRRSVLKASAGALSAGTLAGCLSEPGGSGGDEHTGYAAFFTLWDWAEHVGGDAFTFENPVTVGEVGHGWEPDGDLAAEIATTDAFIYLDTPEFAWAQNIAAQLETDYDDVAVIDGMDGLSQYLLSIDRDVAPEPDEFDDDPASVDVVDFDLLDGRTGDVTAYWHDKHWHENVPDVPVDEGVPIDAVFQDSEGRVLPLGVDEPFQFDVRLADGAPEEHLELESHGDHVELHGVAEGRTLLVFQLRHGEEVLWETDDDAMPVDVVSELDEDEVDEFVDPHVWVDPVLAQEIVETIANRLGEVDPDNADQYATNADDYVERLADVDRQFKELLDAADRDFAIFAGHDSFQYLEHRYGFELHTPVGVSPAAAESFADIADLVDLVEAHDIDTILYDPFEAPNPDEDLPNMVELLLEDGSASEAAPLSPTEGTTDEWNDAGWGWIEQMEEVNLPSLEKALDAA